MSIHGVLGETTRYPKTYQPDTLYPIPRTLGRDAISQSLAACFNAEQTADLSVGYDWWHAFEVSWLNLHGVSQVAMARFSIPANSPNIIESKSLKLYLNSLNFTEFESLKEVESVIAKDLSMCAGSTVEVSLYKLNDLNVSSGLMIDTPLGRCIDRALDNLSQKLPILQHPDASLLVEVRDNKTQQVKDESASSHSARDDMSEKDYQLYSNLLRSNCPVTNQPDWGTLAIEMTTKTAVNKANILSYILSYRQHNGFHEQCVEQIFADLYQYFEPSKLMVRAWYTRRGGIDINPCRVSDLSLLPKPSRLIRQ